MGVNDKAGEPQRTLSRRERRLRKAKDLNFQRCCENLKKYKIPNYYWKYLACGPCVELVRLDYIQMPGQYYDRYNRSSLETAIANAQKSLDEATTDQQVKHRLERLEMFMMGRLAFPNPTEEPAECPSTPS